jgi:hypothetical protein
VQQDVQFLHQTAKEYLLETTTLREVFKEDIQCFMNDTVDGNAMMLEYCLQWLDFPANIHARLGKVLRAYIPETEVLEYAPLLTTESIPPVSSNNLLSRTPTPKTRLLQELDAKLCSFNSFGETWPESNCDAFPERQNGKASTWKSNFLSFAVSMGMRYYVAETLNGNPGLVNAKPGRLLLHYAVYGSGTCRPTLVLDLIAQHVNINAVFVETEYSKTAIQSIVYPGSSAESSGSEDIFKVIEYLVQVGADPNSRLYLDDHDSLPSRGGPMLLPHVARMQGLASTKFKLCKLLVAHNAKTDGLIESLCHLRGGGVGCPDVLTWLLEEKGVLATKQMRGKPENYPYYPWDNPEYNPPQTVNPITWIFRRIF